jgi:hypothetical protein
MIHPLAYDPRHALNAICPYFTMFPMEYPMRALAKHRVHKPVVIDPFCGRGTTLYAARVLGLKARGIGTSPIAVAIAQAKLCSAEKKATLTLARAFVEEGKTGTIPDSPFFRRAFHPDTLRHICAIRHGLLGPRGSSDAAVLLRAATLGCLHGPTAKNLEQQGYFSNQMPRTFASKPDYSVRYWRRYGLRAPKVDALKVLARKLNRIQLPKSDVRTSIADVKLGDSRCATSLPTSKRDFSVVVTSPPYFGMCTYVQDQWLRNWFIGGAATIDYARTEQLSHAGKAAFAESLGQVWRNMARSEFSDLDMYVRFGTIACAKADAKELMAQSLEDSGTKWRCVSTRAASTASAGRRQAAQMSAGSDAPLEYDFHLVRR